MQQHTSVAHGGGARRLLVESIVLLNANLVGRVVERLVGSAAGSRGVSKDTLGDLTEAAAKRGRKRNERSQGCHTCYDTHDDADLGAGRALGHTGLVGSLALVDHHRGIVGV